jgi:hypothetical protein
MGAAKLKYVKTKGHVCRLSFAISQTLSVALGLGEEHVVGEAVTLDAIVPGRHLVQGRQRHSPRSAPRLVPEVVDQLQAQERALGSVA